MGDQVLSYDELVEHIVSNRPVPNIVEVPNLALDASLRTESQLKPRPKPWEKTASTESEPAEIDQDTSKDETVTFPVAEATVFARNESFDSLSKYYAIESEFEKHLEQFFDNGNGDPHESG
ncbi:LAMI_0A07800g1_1 [Lachancea mirantina]|uniref:LAMI_0A07800g1_1 n=1 Tax=Lachancea mirantina TaxID=1230905 RepID=A0A1G4IRN3_9SACH|nr:LAMI_0A07800g1_1 [Lachancea mirantina]